MRMIINILRITNKFYPNYLISSYENFHIHVLAYEMCIRDRIKSGEDLLTWARIAVKTNFAYSLHPMGFYNMGDGLSLIHI